MTWSFGKEVSSSSPRLMVLYSSKSFCFTKLLESVINFWFFGIPLYFDVDFINFFSVWLFLYFCGIVRKEYIVHLLLHLINTRWIIGVNKQFFGVLTTSLNFDKNQLFIDWNTTYYIEVLGKFPPGKLPLRIFPPISLIVFLLLIHLNKRGVGEVYV